MVIDESSPSATAQNRPFCPHLRRAIKKCGQNKNSLDNQENAHS